MSLKNTKIIKIETIPIKIMTARAMKSAKGTTAWMNYILIKVYGSDGAVGIGEIECMPSYNRIGPEAPKGAQQLVDETIGPLILGMNPFDIELIYKKMNDFVQGHIWVKAGVDLALWDLMGKSLGVPT